MKILIGYDGSEYADYALEDLANAGLPDAGEAIVFTVGEAWELPLVAAQVSPSATGFVLPAGVAVGQHLSEVEKRALETATVAARKLQTILPGWTISAQAIAGKTAVELINKADEWSPDLIAVGSHGRSAVGRFFLGSVSQKVLNESKHSVRICRKRTNGNDSELRILVAVDGSENSELAVKEVASRKWKPGTTARIIAVNDPFNRMQTGYLTWNLKDDRPEDSEKSREWIERVINAPVRLLESAGLPVSDTIRWGDAGNIILHEASEWKADTIFLGARGLSKLKRFLLGSVSSFVAVRAECSVEVIRERI